MEDRLNKLEEEVALIKERNQRVEVDKAWETSIARKISVLVITYILATLVMYIIGVQNFFIDSIIPTLGYFLSTQSLPFIKKWWVGKR